MIDALLGYKGNQAAAKAARQTAEFNAQVAENEAVLLQRRKVDEEARMRQGAERTVATQRVATAASGVQMSGSALQAMADSYFNTEMDALNIQYAADIEQTAKASEAAITRAEGRARSTALKVASYQSLLSGAEKAATFGMG
mgnify:CR=1 FL=1|tara:strand:- start:6879 stop:7304 length:426 start_codon:yes stop_codon:yes gene_type:complete